MSAGKHCKLAVVVRLTGGRKRNPASLGSVTRAGSLSRRCLRRLVTPLQGTKLIGDVQNTCNKCVLKGRPAGVATKSVVEILRKPVDPIRKVRSRRPTGERL